MTAEPLSTRGEYTIHGEAAEANRLAVQAQVMSDATSRLLADAGLTSGWSCLDVGCGGGQVSLDLARRVGPDGSVVGVDLSDYMVAQASDAADQAGLGNVRFQAADVYALPFQDRFDLAYARLVLSYLAEPVLALRGMAAAVVEGGVVVVEDLFTDSLRSEPATPALDDLRRIYGAAVRAHAGDPAIGPRLPALFQIAGLTDVHATSTVNVMRSVEEKESLVTLVDLMRQSMIETEAATGEEIDAMRAGVAAAAQDPDCRFHQARIHQVWGRRPKS
jgi:ubiquinone/menaquinone biosynthesis C-methylase UbiE